MLLTHRYICYQKEYLASSFGTILFNSSEEGSSLSLQNKINSFDMINIYLGEAKDVSSLQLLLSNSPYQFIVFNPPKR